MSQFFLQRLATLIATLAVASLVVFGVLEVLPGNAAQVLMGPDADPAAVAAKATELGLDRPALTRYADWMRGLLQDEAPTSLPARALLQPGAQPPRPLPATGRRYACA